MHGGFDNESPTVPTDAIMKLDAVSVLKSSPVLLGKIEDLFGISSSGNSPSPSTPTGPGTHSGASTPTEKEGGIILKKPQIENIEDMEEEKSMKGSKIAKQGGVEALYNLFLAHLLKPKAWASNEDDIAGTEMDRFHFRSNYILALVDECQKIIEEQPMVLKVESPVKVFGDIHGQYQDLMRFFDLWGEPSDKGDIESYDYLFLGDYVDRGSHSLETICLLMALKIKYPSKIHLLRGNHEDKWINNAFGFAEECNTRLNEDPGEPDSVFNRVNELFDWLPLSAIIEEKIVCLHGGIGSTLASLEQIEAIQRPLEVIHEVSTPEQQLVVDILWSDPTDNDQELGIQPNFIRDPNGTGNIVKFGPDRVKQFLENNDMSIILRAHE